MDSAAIEAALIAHLSSDLTLAGFMPGGVYLDIGPSGAQQFVIVSLVFAEDHQAMGERAIEQATYLVKAVHRHTSAATVRQAAARIDALLDRQQLTIAGYSHMALHRAERVRYTEVDQIDADTRWQHAGGRYEVWVSPDPDLGSPGSP